jgi:hypothetical protein
MRAEPIGTAAQVNDQGDEEFGGAGHFAADQIGEDGFFAGGLVQHQFVVNL